jgi:2-polyprenyl-6-methoxyphenol hydroxylase-like FAD-dependent oxidoreductase
MFCAISTVLLLLLTCFLVVLIWKSNKNKVKIQIDRTAKVDCQVIVVGGGPVGLLLASRLIQLDIHTIVLEKREKISSDGLQHSKAIGIHPPSLELFQQLDSELVRNLCNVSVMVKEGFAFANGFDKAIGSLKLDVCRGPFNFVLSCPQHLSEQLLRDTLESQIEKYNKRNGTNHEMFIKGVSVTDAEFLNNRVIVRYEKNSQQFMLSAHFAVGCDGKKSIIREKCNNNSYKGSAYRDTFVMGDFEDNTHYGNKAAIFLADDGLVECFPLPNNLRRWVCSTDTYIKNPSRDFICELVNRRTFYDITCKKHYMLSSFGVQGYVVNRFYDNTHYRFVLAGDSAHICSPLGGQGMNLGWIDAWNLSHTLQQALCDRQACIKVLLEEYDRKQMKLAKAVMHRAELNMALGRRPKLLKFRNLLVRLCLVPFPPLQYLIASFFTMRWLGNISIGNQYVFL